MSIALESNVRSNLNSLQSIAKSLNTTESRLASGKKVNSIIDNPTNFFAARSLNTRADKLNARLDSMGQAVQTINAANAGIDSIRSLVSNMKAIVNDAMANSSVSSRRDLGDQYNTVLSQISLIAQDSGYAGVNLLTNNQNLSIDFSETNGASTLVVKGLALEGEGGNGVSEVAVTKIEYRSSKASVGTVSSRVSQASVASKASSASVGTFSAASIASQSSVASQAVLASQGTVSGQASIGTAASVASQASIASRAAVSTASTGTVASTASQSELFSRASSASTGTVAQVNATYTQKYAFSMQVTAGDTNSVVGLHKASTGAPSGNKVGDHRVDFGASNYIDKLTELSNELDNFDNALQTQAARLSTNLNIVTVREDFTTSMVDNLEAGADKLVLADTNEEGANLLALQTRQQLAVQSLSLSSQANQQVLRLLS